MKKDSIAFKVQIDEGRLGIKGLVEGFCELAWLHEAAVPAWFKAVVGRVQIRMTDLMSKRIAEKLKSQVGKSIGRILREEFGGGRPVYQPRYGRPLFNVSVQGPTVERGPS